MKPNFVLLRTSARLRLLRFSFSRRFRNLRKAIIFWRYFSHFPYIGKDANRIDMQKIAVDRRLGEIARTMGDTERAYSRFIRIAPCVLAEANFKVRRDLKSQAVEMSGDIAVKTYILQSAIDAARNVGIAAASKEQYLTAYKTPINHFKTGL